MSEAIQYAVPGWMYVGPPLDRESQMTTFIKYMRRAAAMRSERARRQELLDGLLMAGLDAPVEELLERYRLPDGTRQPREDGKPSRSPIDPVLRAAVYDRDGHACVYCGARLRLTLDHVLPWSRGGLDTYENLVTACRRCNSSKRAQTPAEWKGRA